MRDQDARIFVSSVKNASNRLEYYGDANLSGIQLLKLIYKYVEYSTTYDQLQRLNSMVSTLQTTDPFICLEYQAVKSYVSNICTLGSVEIGTEGNVAPTLSDINITVIGSESLFQFSYDILFSGYNDDGNGLATSFTIHTVPDYGILSYNDIEVVSGQTFTNPSLLKWDRSGTDSAQLTSFTFSAYDDDSQLPLQSNIATCNVTVEELSIINDPATVGDRAQYAGNRATTVFTVEDFTTLTILPYFDPENNDLDAIRIDEISTANTGEYFYYENPVVSGQVITKAELEAGAFYHQAPDENSITTDSFNASVRDDGSMIWVQ